MVTFLASITDMKPRDANPTAGGSRCAKRFALLVMEVPRAPRGDEAARRRRPGERHRQASYFLESV
jgi:hypothetical protein